MQTKVYHVPVESLDDGRRSMEKGSKPPSRQQVLGTEKISVNGTPA